MVELKKYEQELLDGKHGEFKQKAMQFIVDYAHVLGASRLCKVSRATVAVGAQHWQPGLTKENYGEQFSRFYLNSDKPLALERFFPDCVCQSDSAPCDLFEWEAVHMPKDMFDLNNWVLGEMRRYGVSTVNSCTPYYVGWLLLPGNHFVTNESSNALMTNSVMGACGNSDGVESAMCSAITGYTPLWGLHCKENRYGTVVFDLHCPSENCFDWDIIGYTVGRLLSPHGKPVLTGNFSRPDISMLRQCFSSLATTSAAEICHVPGITPEARDLCDALGGKKPQAIITVSESEYRKSLDMICDKGPSDIDLVSIGCPHISLAEVAEIAEKLEGKKLAPNVELWIWTDFAIQAMAELNGYQAAIEKSGARLFNSSCPLMMREQSHRHAKSILLSSVKQAHNLRAQTDAKIFFGNLDACLASAISGYWQGND